MPVYKRTDKKGCWFFSFYYNGVKYKLLNWKKINGKSKTFDSKTEAQLAESKYRIILENPKELITLYNLYDEYVLNTKSTLKESSLKRYNVFRRNYLVLIKDKLIDTLDLKDILKWKNEVLKLNITSQTKSNIKNIMLQVLKYGSQMYDLKGKLQMPLLENIKDNNPVQVDTKIKYIPPKDFEILIAPLYEYKDFYNNYYYYVIIKVLYNTGLRIGELTALTINDIKPDYIQVNKDYARVDGKDIIQSPKSKNSIRKVYLDDETKKLIQEYISKYQPDGVLFKMNQPYLCQQRVRDKLSTLGKITKLDEKYEIKIHNLRHSHASNLRALGFDEVAISKRLGNTPDVAMSIYLHTKDDELQEMAAKINTIVPK